MVSCVSVKSRTSARLMKYVRSPAAEEEEIPLQFQRPKVNKGAIGLLLCPSTPSP